MLQETKGEKLPDSLKKKLHINLLARDSFITTATNTENCKKNAETSCCYIM